MRRFSRGALALLLAAGGLTGTATAATAAVGAAGAAAVGAQAPATVDIAERLKAIPGMKVEEKTSTLPGYRWFWLTYRQPVDHRRPHGPWFEQRVMLQHKSEDRPMVLYTSGYHTPETMFRSEPTALVDGNQISLEHRFFSPSRPEPADWTKDTIWQAATDEHRLITALKKIYKGRWITTGGSKGGMTAVYHKRFYPHDVDGSVIYVAPNDYNNDDDSAYDRFFANVGTDPECRAHVKKLAREFLKRRPAMLKRFKADAAKNGWTFTILRTPDRAFENSVMDYEWGFWQYNLQSDCASLPPLDASDDVLYENLNAIAGLEFYTDQGLDPYIPYYYQAGTQLGWPKPQFWHLRPLLRYEESYHPRTYVPRDIPMRYDGGRAMRDIDRWVRHHAEHMLFLYGENDPWGAKPFRLGPGSRDSAVYTAPGMNHSGRLIDRLPDEQRAKAVADLLRWAGVSAPQVTAMVSTPSDATDPMLDRRPPL
ncbi:tripeptidyl aminopeptidase [Actinomadura rubrobrunea]|uniref:Tripeptidyl aminopeptidase n=1 Tax=Actinomadura rubrobrunea TaxID=115335 RepID=A0A9W6UXQ1_9ACTN|nr:S28 family serine protease [Actinomadura rubrobrunea]GLW65492.1 tripeptidyl aminopeptidase [Actinomadura rubrobrunea]